MQPFNNVSTSSAAGARGRCRYISRSTPRVFALEPLSSDNRAIFNTSVALHCIAGAIGRKKFIIVVVAEIYWISLA